MRGCFQIFELGLLFDIVWQPTAVFTIIINMPFICNFFYRSVVGLALLTFHQPFEPTSKAQEVRVQERSPQLLKADLF